MVVVKKAFKKSFISLLPLGQLRDLFKVSVGELLKHFSISFLTIKSREDLVNKLETPSLYYNLKLYSKTLTNYHYNLNKNFNGLDYDDSLLFETIVENLCKELLKDNEISSFFLLYEKIYEVFIENLIWKREKSISLSETRTSGIYIIYNKESLITYVGESGNIEKRFFQHYNNLLQGCHHNKGLQKACSIYGIDSFVFLVVQYGDIYKDLAFRRETEVKLINSWPGLIYNIKDVFR
jgi:predicted GIY-YIG superfamily endonuclease